MHSIPEAVAVEARAKIIWGASTDSVLKFLKDQNVTEKDAMALLEEILTERAEMVRSEGITKIWSGALLVMVPVGYFCIALLLGSLRVRLFAALILVGLYGAARLTRGLLMVRNPRSVSGDLSNADDF